MIIDEHVNQSKKETIYERAKQGYANALKKVLMQILRCKQSLRYFKAKTI